MTNDAYGTVEVPAAPKQKSIKRLVACSDATRRLIDFGRGSVAARGVCSVTSAIVIREEPARSRAVESRTALARARERP